MGKEHQPAPIAALDQKSRICSKRICISFLNSIWKSASFCSIPDSVPDSVVHGLLITYTHCHKKSGWLPMPDRTLDIQTLFTLLMNVELTAAADTLLEHIQLPKQG